MFKKYFFIITFIFYSLNCFAQQQMQTPYSPQIFTEAKNNIAITSKNPIFYIKLKSNPTTGYSWFLREYDSQLLAPIAHQFQKNDDKKLAMGAPGTEMWTFKVKPKAFIVPQQTVLRFVYMRPWQDNDNSKQMLFRVTIRK